MKTFFDATKNYILLFTLIVSMPFFFVTVGANVMKINLLASSHRFFYYNTRIHRNQKAFLTKV